MTEKKSILGGMTILLSVISSMLFLDTIAPSANLGPQVVSWYFIMALIFFIPMGTIVGELAATYPDKGGVYSWIKRAFGEKWAARTSWVYWINAALWMPATIIFISGVIEQLFFPSATLVFHVIIGVILSWIVVYISSLTAEESTMISAISGIIKLILPVLLVGTAVIYLINNEPATDITMELVLPNFGESLVFLPVVIYNMCGLEIILGNVHKFNNPQKDVPKSVITAAVVMSLVYIVTAIAILLIIPENEVGIVKGFLDAFIVTFGDGFIARVAIIGIGILFIGTLLIQVQQWSLGASIVAAESSANKELPKIFGKYNKNDSPIGALIVTGVVSSSVIVIYGLVSNTAEDLFWKLFEFSSMLFLMPYIVLVFAFIKLRKTDPNIVRPFRVPVGDGFATFMAWFMAIIIGSNIVFFIWVPGIPIDWDASTPVLIGVFVALVAGEIITRITMNKNSN